MGACTRWVKYDRDKLWLVYTQIVPVIFEPPCILNRARWRRVVSFSRRPFLPVERSRWCSLSGWLCVCSRASPDALNGKEISLPGFEPQLLGLLSRSQVIALTALSGLPVCERTKWFHSHESLLYSVWRHKTVDRSAAGFPRNVGSCSQVYSPCYLRIFSSLHERRCGNLNSRVLCDAAVSLYTGVALGDRRWRRETRSCVVLYFPFCAIQLCVLRVVETFISFIIHRPIRLQLP
jgi:hypothetical protein